MTTRLPDPDGDTIDGDPRLIDVESTFDETSAVDGADVEAAPSGPTRWERIRRSFERSGDDLIGGVGAELGRSLGVDTLWIRLAFVVLALVGGLGVFVYGGLWLALIVGADRRWARIVGGVIVIALVPLFISGGRPSLATGTGAVLVLLAGLTLALWNRGVMVPDAQTPVAARPSAPDRSWTHDPEITHENPVVRVSDGEVNEPPPHTRRTEREPASPLGRSTLGAAVVVAAVGALIDESNGGRLHPEQWLGAAAVVCGVGLLTGAIRGRARWLVFPALAFAGAGFVGGALAQVGLPIDRIGSDSFITIGDGSVDRVYEPRSAFGEAFIDIAEAPGADDPITIDARAAFSDVYVNVADDVAVLFRADIDGGIARMDGRSQSGDFTIGPDGPPAVIVEAHMVRGDLDVWTYDPDDVVVPEPIVSEPFDVLVGNGLTLRSDGVVFVDDGEVVIGADDVPISGSFLGDGPFTLLTSSGQWQLSNSFLTTPEGVTVDLKEVRNGTDIVWPPVTSMSPIEIGDERIDPSTQPTFVPAPVEPTFVPAPVEPASVEPAPVEPPPATTIVTTVAVPVPSQEG